MKLEKQEIIDIVKANGLNEEEAEKLLEMLSKKVGGALVDVIKLAVSKTENSIDDVLVMAGESTLRKLIDEIDINL
jgi:hypothetical protein